MSSNRAIKGKNKTSLGLSYITSETGGLKAAPSHAKSCAAAVSLSFHIYQYVRGPIIAVHLGVLVLLVHFGLLVLLHVAICPLSIVLILAGFVVIRAQYQSPRAPFYVEHPSSLLWQVQFKGELRFKGFSCKLISPSKPGTIRVTHVQRHHLDFVLTKYQLNAPIIPLHCQTANLSLCSQLSPRFQLHDKWT